LAETVKTNSSGKLFLTAGWVVIVIGPSASEGEAPAESVNAISSTRSAGAQRRARSIALVKRASKEFSTS
jgi:hypothetical protein